MVARGDLHRTARQRLGADHHAHRHAQQIGIGEHHARANRAIIVDHLYASLLQLIVQRVGRLAYLGLIHAHGAQMHGQGAMLMGQMGP